MSIGKLTVIGHLVQIFLTKDSVFLYHFTTQERYCVWMAVCIQCSYCSVWTLARTLQLYACYWVNHNVLQKSKIYIEVLTSTHASVNLYTRLTLTKHIGVLNYTTLLELFTSSIMFFMQLWKTVKTIIIRTYCYSYYTDLIIFASCGFYQPQCFLWDCCNASFYQRDVFLFL